MLVMYDLIHFMYDLIHFTNHFTNHQCGPYKCTLIWKYLVFECVLNRVMFSYCAAFRKVGILVGKPKLSFNCCLFDEP